MALWAPETSEDLARIWRHHRERTDHPDEAAQLADQLIDDLLRIGEHLTVFGAVAGLRAGEFKKRVSARGREFLFFFRPVRGDIEILGLFAIRENWRPRMAERPR